MNKRQPDCQIMSHKFGTICVAALFVSRNAENLIWHGCCGAESVEIRYERGQKEEKKEQRSDETAAANGEGKWNFSLLNGASQRVPCPHAREVA